MNFETKKKRQTEKLFFTHNTPVNIRITLFLYFLNYKILIKNL